MTVVGISFLLIGGCGDVEAPEERYVVRDSAGIRLVENGLADIPTIDLEGREVWAFSDYLFVQVRDGAIRHDGFVAVSDVRGDEVVVLDPEGSLAYVLGGTGEGPEDLSSPFTLVWLDGDTLLVQDIGNTRYSLFVGEASAGASRIPPMTAFASILSHVPASTRLVLDDGSYMPESDEDWVTNEVYLYDRTAATADTIHEFDVARGRADIEAPFEPFAAYGTVAARDSSLFSVRGDRAEVRRLDLQGRWVEAWRWAEAPTPVTDSIWDAYVEWRMGLGDSAPPEERRREIDAARRLMAGTLPYTSSLHVDAAGRVWVGAYSRGSRTTRYRLFSRDGRYLADIRVPPRTEIFDITADHLLAAVRDEFDVPTLVLFDLSEVPHR